MRVKLKFLNSIKDEAMWITCTSSKWRYVPAALLVGVVSAPMWALRGPYPYPLRVLVLSIRDPNDHCNLWL